MTLDKDLVASDHHYELLDHDLPSSRVVAGRLVDTPHQLALRQKAAKHQRKSLVYLGPISEDWAVACHKAHPAGYLLACAIRTRSTLRGGGSVSVGQTLADHLGISRDGRKRALAALEAAGLIKVERKPGCVPRASLLAWKTKRLRGAAILSAHRQE